jgi:hypothetical protein
LAKTAVSWTIALEEFARFFLLLDYPVFTLNFAAVFLREQALRPASSLND